jgi:hypothetical protein
MIEHDFNKDGEKLFKEIYIDVTDSIPHFDSPMETLSSVLDRVTGEFSRRPTILDLGAGKLRNTLYLLEQGYRKRVCDYFQEHGIDLTVPQAQIGYDKISNDEFNKNNNNLKDLR